MSRPGFPRHDYRSYSYSSNFIATNGSSFPGHNSGSYHSYVRDSVGPNSPGWPHNKVENPYMTFSCSVSDSPISYNFVAPGVGVAFGSDSSASKGLGFDAVGTIMDVTWPMIETMYSQAMYMVNNRLISQIKDQKVNYAQVFAEREQTVNLIASTARKLADAFLAVRRGNVRHAIHTLTGSANLRRRGLGRVAGDVPDQWLALQYGWKPLLQDVYGSAEELAKYWTGSDKSGAFCSVYGSARTGMPGFFQRGASSVGDCDWEFRTTGTSAHGRGFVLYEVSNSVAHVASRTGLTNPLQLAWELLPYSFVVDWFLPVGNFLANLDYQAGLRFKRGWHAVKIEVDWTGKPINTNRFPTGFSSGGWSGGSIDAKVKYFQRLPELTFPSVQLPRLKDPFSPTHAANALSLLSAAFSSSSRIR